MQIQKKTGKNPSITTKDWLFLFWQDFTSINEDESKEMFQFCQRKHL